MDLCMRQSARHSVTHSTKRKKNSRQNGTKWKWSRGIGIAVHVKQEIENGQWEIGSEVVDDFNDIRHYKFNYMLSYTLEKLNFYVHLYLVYFCNTQRAVTRNLPSPPHTLTNPIVTTITRQPHLNILAHLHVLQTHTFCLAILDFGWLSGIFIVAGRRQRNLQATVVPNPIFYPQIENQNCV